MYAVAVGLEFLTPLAPRYFLLLASVANVGKSVGLATHISTQPSFVKNFARQDNLSDLTAKAQVRARPCTPVLLCSVLFWNVFVSPASPQSNSLDGRLYSHSSGRTFCVTWGFINGQFVSVLTFPSVWKDVTKQGDLSAFTAIAQVAPCQQSKLCCALCSIITSLCLFFPSFLQAFQLIVLARYLLGVPNPSPVSHHALTSGTKLHPRGVRRQGECHRRICQAEPLPIT